MKVLSSAVLCCAAGRIMCEKCRSLRWHHLFPLIHESSALMIRLLGIGETALYYLSLSSSYVSFPRLLYSISQISYRCHWSRWIHGTF